MLLKFTLNSTLFLINTSLFNHSNSYSITILKQIPRATWRRNQHIRIILIIQKYQPQKFQLVTMLSSPGFLRFGEIFFPFSTRRVSRYPGNSGHFNDYSSVWPETSLPPRLCNNQANSRYHTRSCLKHHKMQDYWNYSQN